MKMSVTWNLFEYEGIDVKFEMDLLCTARNDLE